MQATSRDALINSNSISLPPLCIFVQDQVVLHAHVELPSEHLIVLDTDEEQCKTRDAEA